MPSGLYRKHHLHGENRRYASSIVAGMEISKYVRGGQVDRQYFEDPSKSFALRSTSCDGRKFPRRATLISILCFLRLHIHSLNS